MYEGARPLRAPQFLRWCAAIAPREGAPKAEFPTGTMRRRDFFGVGVAMGTPALLPRLPLTLEPFGQGVDESAERAFWVQMIRRLADPVLDNLSAGTLKARMPVEEAQGAKRAAVTHLEGFGRLVAGLAPWIELEPSTSGAAGDEHRLRQRYAGLARTALANAVDPSSPDAMNFTAGGQPLVDAAFLAQGILRAPRALWSELEPQVQARVIQALESTRNILPGANNWLLFSATVEAALSKMGAWWDRMRVDYALRQHEQWYKGDGIYGDGPDFHWDYYNSFVIHPMLLDVLAAVGGESPGWERLREPMLQRARRYAAILERQIAPDGTFPAVGRSLAYRCGAFQSLAQMALLRQLPADLPPGQARAALSAVIRRTLEAPGTFDDQGWLRIGLSGHQPGVGERYISTGSLYLCAAALLPLGLPADDLFWTAPAEPWTGQRAWSGKPFPIDRAL